MAEQPWDLRRVLAEIKDDPKSYHETNVQVDPEAELAGVYRYIGAGGTVERPTKEGPAMMFNNVKGFPDTRVLIGLMASRRRVGKMFHHDYQTLGQFLNDSVSNPVAPVTVAEKDAPAHEVVYKATDEGLIFVSWWRHQPTLRLTRARTLPLGSCSARAWTSRRVTSRFTGWS